MGEKDISLCLEDGKMETLNTLQMKFKKKEVMEQIEKDGFYLHNDRYIPYATARLIADNTRGISLNTIMCKHCKKESIMTIRTILNEECKWCCNCNRNIYDKSDKTVIDKRW